MFSTALKMLFGQTTSPEEFLLMAAKRTATHLDIKVLEQHRTKIVTPTCIIVDGRILIKATARSKKKSAVRYREVIYGDSPSKIEEATTRAREIASELQKRNPDLVVTLRSS